MSNLQPFVEEKSLSLLLYLSCLKIGYPFLKMGLRNYQSSRDIFVGV